MDYEYIIIGAGVVGLACAYNFSKKSNRVVLIERHGSLGNETSSRNSEVIHAGIYYPTNSLKAVLCVRGNPMLYEFCARHNVPARRIGKFIISVDKDDEQNLSAILQKARDNGVPGIAETTLEKINQAEPSIKCTAALWSADTGIIDSHRLMAAFEESSKLNGCDIAYRHSCHAIEKIDGGYKIFVEGPDKEIFSITAEKVINSAGLDSDTVASMSGIDIDQSEYRLVYARGHYFRIRPGLTGMINHLIYPVPPADKASLGIHVTLEFDGQMKLGPDVENLPDRRQIYTVDEGLRSKFHAAAARYILGLQPEDIAPDQSGIRPKLQRPGQPPKDFIINEESSKGLPGLVNLIGIESPGLTSCLAIAEYVENLLS